MSSSSSRRASSKARSRAGSSRPGSGPSSSRSSRSRASTCRRARSWTPTPSRGRGGRPTVDTMTLAIAGIAALAILLIAVGVAMSGSGSGINAPLERYASTKPETPVASASGEGGLAAALQSSQALNQLNKVVEQRDFGANLARELARADLRLKPSEYLAIWAATTLGVPLLMLVFSVVFETLGNPIVLFVRMPIGLMVPR